MIRCLPVILTLIASVPVMAQDRPPQRLIQVVGTGLDRSMPDIALLEYSIRGEGDSADAAATALAAKQRAVATGLTGLLGAASELSTGIVNISEVRDRTCDDGRNYGEPARLSRGACVVVGYVATLHGQLRTRAVDKAATAVGLAARLGAGDARLGGFILSDSEAAQRRAAEAAMKDARQRAAAAAAGAGVRLGDLVSIRDQGSPILSSDIVVRAAAPSVPLPPPVEIGVKPRPIETRAQLAVSYEIGQ